MNELSGGDIKSVSGGLCEPIISAAIIGLVLYNAQHGVPLNQRAIFLPDHGKVRPSPVETFLLLSIAGSFGYVLELMADDALCKLDLYCPKHINKKS